jgi:hypothetical protein
MVNPELLEDERAQRLADLMSARRAVAAALHTKDADAEKLARRAVDAAKRGLGELGPP